MYHDDRNGQVHNPMVEKRRHGCSGSERSRLRRARLCSSMVASRDHGPPQAVKPPRPAEPSYMEKLMKGHNETSISVDARRLVRRICSRAEPRRLVRLTRFEIHAPILCAAGFVGQFRASPSDSLSTVFCFVQQIFRMMPFGHPGLLTSPADSTAESKLARSRLTFC